MVPILPLPENARSRWSSATASMTAAGSRSRMAILSLMPLPGAAVRLPADVPRARDRRSGALQARWQLADIIAVRDQRSDAVACANRRSAAVARLIAERSQLSQIGGSVWLSLLRPHDPRDTSVAFTCDCYGHLLPEAGKQVAARLEAVRAATRLA